MSRYLTWSGVRLGSDSRRRATAPATMGADMEVPDMRNRALSTRLDGCSLPMVSLLFPGSSATMFRPGATISGFTVPASVTP